MPKGVYLHTHVKPKVYPLELVCAVQSLYESGKTQDEIATEVGLTQKVIWKLMRNHGIQTRPQVIRDQRREKNSNWRGDAVSYAAYHYRVEAARGKPAACGECGTTDISKTYDWANLTGHYEDVNDYQRMCRSCHWKFDQKILNIRHMREREVQPCHQS